MDIVGWWTFSTLAATLPPVEGAAAVCVFPLSVQILELQLRNLVHHQFQMCNQGKDICTYACFKMAGSTVQIIV